MDYSKDSIFLETMKVRLFLMDINRIQFNKIIDIAIVYKKLNKKNLKITSATQINQSKIS